MFNMKEAIKEGLDACIECETCMEEGICPTYTVKKEKVYSPFGRINLLRKLLSEPKHVDEEMKESLLTCTGCGRCTEVCPVDVNIGELVTLGRGILYRMGELPTERQKRIIESIKLQGNAVGRKEEEKAIHKDPFYKRFMDEKCETLLFIGCISSFFQERAVKSSLKILEHIGVEFSILEREGCCGIFLFDGGYFDTAKEVFERNVEKFESLGVKRIITMCASCQKCFSLYYEKILGDFPFEVTHFIQVLYENLGRGKTLPVESESEFVLHEPCKLTRFMNVIDEPRIVLDKTGIKYGDLPEKGRMCLCCGAGSGVRAYSPTIAMEIAERVIKKAGGKDLITLCPFCSFNFNYTSRKKNLGAEALYISEVLWSKDT